MDIRPATPDDEGPILRLLAVSMDRGDDPRFAELYRWKHDQNHFGSSWRWVAVEHGEVVGVRLFMRWRFAGQGRTWDAVRAVDTATHPDHQGKGIFKALTLHGLDEVKAAGVDFVFNTPNDQSRPGYFKMGWKLVGNLEPSFRPRLRSLHKLPGARRPAEHWGQPSAAGGDAEEVFTDEAAVARLLGDAGVSDALHTERSAGFLRWRYPSFLHYRALTLGTSPADGVAVFRVRRRGSATEASTCDVLVPRGRKSLRRQLFRNVLRLTRADVQIALSASLADGLFPLPGPAPTLVWRAVNSTEPPSREAWDLTLGDIELF